MTEHIGLLLQITLIAIVIVGGTALMRRDSREQRRHVTRLNLLRRAGL